MKNEVGNRYGHLVCLKYVEKRGVCVHLWKFKCDCGRLTIAQIGNVRSGRTRTCGIGCPLRTKYSPTADLIKAYTQEYRTWQAMKDRCYNRNTPAFANYGGRGIRVCERWLHSFVNFLSDIGPRPDKHSIDRIDNDGNYEPDNCRWATQTTQCRNTRRTVFLTVYGMRQPLTWWQPIAGVSRQRMHQRRNKGFTDKEIVFGRP